MQSPCSPASTPFIPGQTGIHPVVQSNTKLSKRNDNLHLFNVTQMFEYCAALLILMQNTEEGEFKRNGLNNKCPQLEKRYVGNRRVRGTASADLGQTSRTGGLGTGGKIWLVTLFFYGLCEQLENKELSTQLVLPKHPPPRHLICTLLTASHSCVSLSNPLSPSNYFLSLYLTLSSFQRFWGSRESAYTNLVPVVADKCDCTS